jgi:hypothetical protein
VLHDRTARDRTARRSQVECEQPGSDHGVPPQGGAFCHTDPTVEERAADDLTGASGVDAVYTFAAEEDPALGVSAVAPVYRRLRSRNASIRFLRAMTPFVENVCGSSAKM